VKRSVSATINGKGYRGHKTWPIMRARYRALGFKMPRGKYKVTYRLHPHGNLIYVGSPGQPVQLPFVSNMTPLIIVNSKSVCFLPSAWDLKRLVRRVKVL
jgi:hypothetical protein